MNFSLTFIKRVSYSPLKRKEKKKKKRALFASGQVRTVAGVSESAQPHSADLGLGSSQ